MMGAQRPPALIRMPASEAEKARQKAEWDAKARDGQTLAKLALARVVIVPTATEVPRPATTNRAGVTVTVARHRAMPRTAIATPKPYPIQTLRSPRTFAKKKTTVGNLEPAPTMPPRVVPAPK